MFGRTAPTKRVHSVHLHHKKTGSVWVWDRGEGQSVFAYRGAFKQDPPWVIEAGPARPADVAGAAAPIHPRHLLCIVGCLGTTTTKDQPTTRVEVCVGRSRCRLSRGCSRITYLPGRREPRLVVRVGTPTKHQVFHLCTRSSFSELGIKSSRVRQVRIGIVEKDPPTPEPPCHCKQRPARSRCSG
jgi:hypothetical protein